MFENKTAEELKNQMSYLLTNVKNLDLFISNKLYNLSLKYHAPDNACNSHYRSLWMLYSFFN